MTNKEQILQTALALFAEQGYDRTPTSQIAREAGVSEGLIFRHFGSKDALLAAIIQLGLSQIAESMQGYTGQAAPHGAIAEHIARSFALVRAHETFWRLVQKARFQPAVRQTAAAQIEEVNRFIVGQLTAHFQQAGSANPQLEALHLFALIDGVTIHYLDNPAEYPLDAMQQFLIQKYSDGNNMG
ncbi:MAG: TetR/AcrR family transcriptional regulator [Saprospiraceae bacterium]|nr:TetR/AcrR family transcriptional regulator [Saprospiraceae bacterium]